MDYRKKDFERLYLNVYDIGAGVDVFKAFPILNNYSSFKKRLDPEIDIQKVIRYVVYAFDKNTPLINIPDIPERRVTAALMAGFKHNTENLFPEKIEQILLSKNLDVNFMIVQYGIIQSNDDFVAMMAYQDVLRRKSQELFSDSEIENTGSAIATMENCRKHIAAIKRELLTADKDPFLSKSLYIFAEAERCMLRPEDMAKLLMQYDPFVKSLRTS